MTLPGVGRRRRLELTVGAVIVAYMLWWLLMIIINPVLNTKAPILHAGLEQ